MAYENHAAQVQHFDQAGTEVAAVVAELIAARASREGHEAGTMDFMQGVGALLASAYNLAKLEGEHGLRFYVDVLRDHADSVEGMLF